MSHAVTNANKIASSQTVQGSSKEEAADHCQVATDVIIKLSLVFVVLWCVSSANGHENDF